MQRENDVMKAIVKLAMCPGDRTKCSYCGVCSHAHHGSNCADVLREEYGFVLNDLNAYLASTVPAQAPSTPATAPADPEMSGEYLALKRHVTNVLHQLGVPAHVKGYRYLRTAIIMAVSDVNVVDAVTKELYPAVAKECKTTPARVERAIRFAIGLAWERADADVLHEYFGETVSHLSGKPTNSEFIGLVSDNIRLELHNIIPK